jgi:hypothetical protein
MKRIRRCLAGVLVVAVVVGGTAQPASAAPSTAEAGLTGLGFYHPGYTAPFLTPQEVFIEGSMSGTFVAVGPTQAIIATGTLGCRFYGEVAGAIPVMTLRGACGGVATNGVLTLLQACTLAGVFVFLPLVLEGTCDLSLESSPGTLATATLQSTLTLSIAPTSVLPTSSFTVVGAFSGRSLGLL